MTNFTCRNRGFTLIELMIVITVAAILLGVGIPSFRDMVMNNRRVATVNNLVSAIHLARTEAYSRNRPVRICIREAANPPQDCNPGGSWADGWIVFIDDNGNENVNEATDGNGAIDTDEGILLIQEPATEGVIMGANQSSFQFTRNRQPTQGTLNVCANGVQRDIRIGPTGHPHLIVVEAPAPTIC